MQVVENSGPWFLIPSSTPVIDVSFDETSSRTEAWELCCAAPHCFWLIVPPTK